MRAQNLTISIPYKGCDKRPSCPYCVSAITGGVESNVGLMHRNMMKVKTLATAAQVSSVLLTGKGEPFLNFYEVLNFSYFFRDFPLEIQTNGIWLGKHLGKEFEELYQNGMNVIAISVDNPALQGDSVKAISEAAHKLGMVVRVTFNVTNALGRFGTSDGLLGLCKKWSVDQMTLRNIVSPNNVKETKQTKWIEKNIDPEKYENLKNSLSGGAWPLIRTLQFGTPVYNRDGIAVSFSDYCIQDGNNNEDIRSLIYLEDGHMYTSWNSKASILF